MNKIVVCNQKMFLTYEEAKELSKKLSKYNDDNLIICPNFLNMDVYSSYNIGAQDCYYEDTGSFTGEISPYHLSLKGVKYVIIGHSERRCYDDDKVINKKVLAAQRNKLVPILCIGETKYDRDLHRTAEAIRKQLTIGLKNVKDKIYIAYEPAWLIGKNKSLNIKEIEDTCAYIRKILKGMNITNYKLLYGGSVTDETIEGIISDKLDGYLVGTACCDIGMIEKIIKCIKM